MLGPFSRSELLLGSEGLQRLANARVAVFGVGGVGSFVAEGLARGGVGHITLFDNDVVSLTNLNRQLVALHSTLGQPKVEIMAARIRDINPQAQVECHACFYMPENAHEYPLESYDYVVDAIDTVTAKLELAQQAHKAGVPIISCMGAGNKLDPTAFCVADIYETSVCPLAKAMRKALRERGVPALRVLYSKEPPSPHRCEIEKDSQKRQTPGSLPFVPSVAGLILAGEVIKHLAGIS